MKRRSRSRRAVGTGVPFAGTNYIETRYYAVQPSLVSAALGTTHGEERERAIRRGQEYLAWLLDQNPGPTAKSRRFVEYKIIEVRRLLAKAGG